MHTILILALGTALASFSLGGASTQGSTPEAKSFESLLQQGFDLHREQQYGRSIPLLEQARTLRPSDYRVNLLLGIDYLRSGQPAKSLTFLRCARSANTQDTVVLGYLAEVYSFLEEFDQAAEALHTATLTSEAWSQTSMSLVHFYLHRFRALAQELRSTRPGLAYAYRLQALALRARGDPGEREVLLQVQALWPELPGLYSALGHLALAQGQFEQAKTWFAKARLLSPDDLDLLGGEAVLAVHFRN